MTTKRPPGYVPPLARQQTKQDTASARSGLPEFTNAKNADWSLWNVKRMPVTTRHAAVCLTLELPPERTPEYNTQKYRGLATKGRPKQYLDLDLSVESHLKADTLEYHGWYGSGDFLINPDFWGFLDATGYPIPAGWRDIPDDRGIDGGPGWQEAVSAAIRMRDDPENAAPRTLEQLYEFMLAHVAEYPHCCKGLVDWTAVKERVRRERKSEALKNPLKHPLFLQAV